MDMLAELRQYRERAHSPEALQLGCMDASAARKLRALELVSRHLHLQLLVQPSKASECIMEVCSCAKELQKADLVEGFGMDMDVDAVEATAKTGRWHD